VIIVPIDIRLADGSVPKRANLMIQMNNSTSSEQWRPGKPDLRLGAGAYTLYATAGDHEEYRSESQSIALKEGGTPPSLSFKLTARTGIRGRVKVPKGYALDSLTIFALRYSGTAVPDESALRRGQNDWASPWNGFQFSFNDLAPGTWLVGAGSWESIFSTKSVEVTAGAISDAVIEIADAGASGLVVRVLGPDNAAVADANVRVDAASGQHDSSEAFTVRPKKDGAWVVAPKKDGAGEGGEWRISVHSARYGDKIVPLPGTMSGELRVEMAEPASLDVTVTGYAGSGLEGRLRVDVRPLTGGKEHQSRVYYSREETLGPDGRQTVKPLQPGRYRVELQYQRERWSNSPLERVDVDVAPGANAISVPVPAVYSLTVLAPGESADSNMNLQLIGGSGEERWNNAKVGPDGTGVFEGLVAGTYRLSIWAPKARRNRSMKVTVPSSGPVQFKEEAETSLLVKVLDTEGYLASAGFQAGDVITGADGAAFDGTRPATQVLNGLMMARKEIKLQVVRAGKTTETTVDTEKFATATNHMRSLEPASR
jgi:hypothetical protein